MDECVSCTKIVFVIQSLSMERGDPVCNQYLPILFCLIAKSMVGDSVFSWQSDAGFSHFPFVASLQVGFHGFAAQWIETGIDPCYGSL
jgi:hypothetical protein